MIIFKIVLLAMVSVQAMKSSRKTSISVSAEFRSASAMSSKLFGSIFVSKACGGRLASSKLEITSCAVLVEAAQKKGGNSHHPIYRAFGTTMRVSSMEALDSSLGMM